MAFLFPLLLMKVWKYYIDETRSDVVLIEVKARYKDSRVFYNKEHIGTIESADEIKKKMFFDCSVGEVSIRTRKKGLEVTLNNNYTLSSVNQPAGRLSKYRTILWVALVLNSLTLVVLFSNPFLGGEYILISNKLLYQSGLVILIIVSIYLSKKRKMLGALLPLVLYLLLSLEFLFIYMRIFMSERINWEKFEKGIRGFEFGDLVMFLPHFLFKILVIIFMIKSIKAIRELDDVDRKTSNSNILDDF